MKSVKYVFAVIGLVAICAGVFAFKNSDPDRPQVFVLKDGNKQSSKAWFHSWFSSDPSVEEIVAQYHKVSGWQSNALKSFVAKGTFKIKNVGGETIVQTQGDIRVPVHFHWDSSDGEVEFEGEAPDKIVITQKYDEPRVWQRGTNGTTGWTRKGWPDPTAAVDPHIRLTYTSQMDVLYPDRLTDLKRGADFINYFHLPNTYPRMYLSGKTMVGDRVAYELTNRTFGEAVDAMYFDVETGMLLMFSSYRHDSPYLPMFDGYSYRYYDSSVLAETYLEDYREVNGLKLPFLIRQHFDKYWINTTITDLQTNVPIDPSVFEKPAS
jgi:hypothetical protein